MPEPTKTEKAPQDAAGRSGEASPKDVAPPYMHALREYRLRRGLSQEAFAQLIGCSIFSIARIETGATRAGDRVVARLAEALGLSIESARQLADGQMPSELQSNAPASGAAPGARVDAPQTPGGEPHVGEPREVRDAG